MISPLSASASRPARIMSSLLASCVLAVVAVVIVVVS